MKLMKLKEIIDEAISIGDDSYELQHFVQLKTSAGNKARIEALKADQSWQHDHLTEISARIDSLIQEIEDD